MNWLKNLCRAKDANLSWKIRSDFWQSSFNTLVQERDALKRQKDEMKFLARPEAPKWLPEDVDQWAAFLSTPTGRKLLESLRAAHFRALVNASNSLTHANELSHLARGFAEAEKFIALLSVSCDAQQQKQTDSGAPGEAPSAESDEAEMLSRMSP